MSFPQGDNMASGVGYYGNPIGNNPVECIDELESINQRTEKGTDVFIYGFKGNGEWENDIIVALLENFLISIYNGHLRVRVQNSEINADTLGSYMKKVHEMRYRETKSTYSNYLCLTRNADVKQYSLDFHGMGTIELKILVDSNEKLDRKVLVVRKAGMKLFRLGNISKLVPFSGIMELKGEALNKYFRSMETVAHDDWEPGRHANPKEAKKYYEEIKEWIRKIVAELAEYTSDDEMEVKGLSGVLQQELDIVEANSSDKKRETLNDYLENIDIIKRPEKMHQKVFSLAKVM